MWITNRLGFVCQLLPMKIEICLVQVLCLITEVTGWFEKNNISGLAVGAGGYICT